MSVFNIIIQYNFFISHRSRFHFLPFSLFVSWDLFLVISSSCDNCNTSEGYFHYQLFFLVITEGGLCLKCLWKMFAILFEFSSTIYKVFMKTLEWVCVSLIRRIYCFENNWPMEQQRGTATCKQKITICNEQTNLTTFICSWGFLFETPD